VHVSWSNARFRSAYCVLKWWIFWCCPLAPMSWTRDFAVRHRRSFNEDIVWARREGGCDSCALAGGRWSAVTQRLTVLSVPHACTISDSWCHCVVLDHAADRHELLCAGSWWCARAGLGWPVLRGRARCCLLPQQHYCWSAQRYCDALTPPSLLLLTPQIKCRGLAVHSKVMGKDMWLDSLRL